MQYVSASFLFDLTSMKMISVFVYNIKLDITVLLPLK